MNGVRILMAVNSLYTPSVRHRGQAEKHLVKRLDLRGTVQVNEGVLGADVRRGMSLEVAGMSEDR